MRQVLFLLASRCCIDGSLLAIGPTCGPTGRARRVGPCMQSSSGVDFCRLDWEGRSEVSLAQKRNVGAREINTPLPFLTPSHRSRPPSHSHSHYPPLVSHLHTLAPPPPLRPPPWPPTTRTTPSSRPVTSLTAKCKLRRIRCAILEQES
jgi:hypothetical protein